MIPEMTVNPQVVELLARLHQAGHEAYIVGGAVRDLLLNLPPKDYDIATSATPGQVRQVFRRQARIIGRRFRLVHVRYGPNIYEVSTYRREPTAEERIGQEGDDGVVIWRDNQYGNREQDAARRDFTVNAIFYNPLKDGEIIDCVGGMADLEEGMVRAIGSPEVRLAEDPVRILRALKLVAQYDFSLEEELEKIVRDQGARIELASQARLYEELLKIFAKPYAVKTLAVCREFDFLRHFLPRINEVWDEPDGLLMRRLAAARDRRKSRGSYWKSRRLALATVALPTALESLGIADPSEFRQVPEDCGRTVRKAIRDLFHPLPLPKFLTHDTKDVILLLPRFFDPSQKERVSRHPQYRWAHELFSLCAEALDWPPELLAEWPPADDGPSPPRRRPQPRRRQRRPRGKDGHASNH